MFASKTVLAVLTVTCAASALPQRRSLPSGTVTCGSKKYSVSQVSAAVAQGYKDYQAVSEVGE
jgi:hypothetical protein